MSTTQTIHSGTLRRFLPLQLVKDPTIDLRCLRTQMSTTRMMDVGRLRHLPSLYRGHVSRCGTTSAETHHEVSESRQTHELMAAVYVKRGSAQVTVAVAGRLGP